MSDTSGQDSSGGGGNGVFSNPTFQKLLQKTIGLVAQLHGGQDPNAAQAGAPTGAQQPGAGAPPQGGPAAALQQAPQPGMPQGPQPNTILITVLITQWCKISKKRCNRTEFHELTELLKL